MAGERTEQTFDDLIRSGLLAIGDGYRAKNEELGGDGPLFLRAGHVRDTHIDFEGVERFHAEFADRVASKMSRAGDVIVTTKGNSTGRVAYVDDKLPRFVYSPHLSFWRSLDPAKLVPGFLRYWSRSRDFRDQLAGFAGSTDMAPYLSLIDQRRLRITLPRPSEQRAIAHILGTLDDKIELNRRMSQALETMALALFKSWFVDFDPVRAKLENRQCELSQVLASLFPSSFESAELGDIPRGWRVGRLDEEFDLTMGQSPPGNTYNEVGDGLPFFQGRADFGFRFPTRRVYCTAPTRLAQVGDTLVSVRAPVGDVNMAAERSCIGRGVAAVRHRSSSRSYTYYFMKLQREAFDRFDAEGTIFGSINKSDFHALQSAVPGAELVRAFERLVAPMDDRIAINQEETLNLAFLRDTLMPKLISGELPLKRAEHIIGLRT